MPIESSIGIYMPIFFLILVVLDTYFTVPLSYIKIFFFVNKQQKEIHVYVFMLYDTSTLIKAFGNPEECLAPSQVN